MQMSELMRTKVLEAERSEGDDAEETMNARLRCRMCKPVSVWAREAYPYMKEVG